MAARSMSLIGNPTRGGKGGGSDKEEFGSSERLNGLWGKAGEKARGTIDDNVK